MGVQPQTPCLVEPRDFGCGAHLFSPLTWYFPRLFCARVLSEYVCNAGSAEKCPTLNGEIFKHEQPGKLYIFPGTTFVVLGSLHGYAKKTIAEFNSSHDLKKIEFIKKQPQVAKPGA